MLGLPSRHTEPVILTALSFPFAGDFVVMARLLGFPRIGWAVGAVVLFVLVVPLWISKKTFKR